MALYVGQPVFPILFQITKIHKNKIGYFQFFSNIFVATKDFFLVHMDPQKILQLLSNLIILLTLMFTKILMVSREFETHNIQFSV